VPADDDEIMARFIGFPLIADLIADDAKAVTYSFGKFQFESYKIPKLKVGVGHERGDGQAAQPHQPERRHARRRGRLQQLGEPRRSTPAASAWTCAARRC
jgi:hypothetical protein